MSALPSSWNVTDLGTVVDVVRGVSYKKPDATNQTGPGLVPILRATNIGEKLTLDGELVFVPDRYVRPEQRLRPGDIIVATSSGSSAVVGKSALLDRPWNGAFGTFCCVIRAKEGVDPRYLGYYLQDRPVRERWSAAARGTNINNLKVSDIVSTPVPLASFAEQRRIVAAIEELISRIDAGVEALNRARRNLQRMRAAVLQAAVMGRLVPQDSEAEHAGILVKRLLEEHPEVRNHTFTFDAHSLPKLPGGWAWLAVGQLGEVVTGRTPDTRRIEYFGPGLPFVTPGDMGEELILRGAARELTDAGAAVARRLPVNSVLATCIGATIGKVGLAAVPCATNQQINALIPFESYALSRWICYAMASPWFFGLLRSQASSTTMPILNKSRFRALPIPLPPIAEQVHVVAEVERHLSLFENLKVAVENNVEHAARLRRSILNSAFAGRLVPRDHSDEPASGLLERMRAARWRESPDMSAPAGDHVDE
jgi:type I restriction enzyme S subunit